jgi:ATP-dependent DNA helicase RecG
VNQILNTPIEFLKGVGPMKGELLRKELEVFTYYDLLQHYPFRYVDKSIFTKIININAALDNVQVVGKITQMGTIGEGFKKRIVVTIKDDTSELDLVWFQGIAWVQKSFLVGDTVVIFGKPNVFNGSINIAQPEIEKYETISRSNAYEPVYNTSEKMKLRGLNSKTIGRLVQTILPMITASDIPDIVPNGIMQHQKLLSRYEAIVNIHTPKNTDTQLLATHTLKFEELFLQQIEICKLKLNKSKILGIKFETIGDNFNTFYNKHLPFALTDDQKKVLKEIRQNTITGLQMNRLLQGDVGSGKTIVALLCMLIALDNNYQACLVAPTEILAQQHLVGITELLKDMPITVKLLTGNIKGKARKLILQELEEGNLQIVIGTHAIFEKTVAFKNLGLAIVDEQHRFGVAQRASLYTKADVAPHILVMTATPIPRTLAMTTYGDLEVSTIVNLPPGRKPIQTLHRTDMHRARILEFAKDEIKLGRQVYIVYPLIEESEKLDYENLMEGYEQVKQFFPDHTYRISMVHGRQTNDERVINMNRFITGDTQIMVATTVIEVGVNVPNASVMIIESAERFGLSQLHQLRGRVGRGAEKSYCVLLTGNKISKDGRERMHTMVTENNGFKISEKDLELRGPGVINGTKQSGIVNLKIADLIADIKILEQARKEALIIIETDAALQKDENYNLNKYFNTVKSLNVWSKIS